MSQAFPTYIQFRDQIRRDVVADYPEAEKWAIDDTVTVLTDEQIWLEHLGKLVKQGVEAEVQVLDGLNVNQLYNLRKHYAPVGALDWYIPARFRVTKKPVAPVEKPSVISCFPPKLNLAPLSSGIERPIITLLDYHVGKVTE